MDLKKLVKEIKNISVKVEPIMLNYVKAYSYSIAQDLYEKLCYPLPDIHLRIRPFLVLLGYEATGRKYTNRLISIGAAIELMQISTLVTDDFLDESLKRNNQPSLFVKYGLKDAILIGSLLKSISTIFLARETKKFGIEPITVLQTLEKAFLDVCVGQYLDIKYESEDDVTIKQYIKMIEKTTASFIDASLQIGALLGKASPELLRCLHNYGVNYGLAYQIRDDIIDIIGEEELTGKPRFIDLKRGKKRLPLLHLLSHIPTKEKKELLSVIKQGKFQVSRAKQIFDLMKSYGSLEFSKSQLQFYCDRARQALNCYDFVSETKCKLEDMVDIVASIDL